MQQVRRRRNNYYVQSYLCTHHELKIPSIPFPFELLWTITRFDCTVLRASTHTHTPLTMYKCPAAFSQYCHSHLFINNNNKIIMHSAWLLTSKSNVLQTYSY